MNEMLQNFVSSITGNIPKAVLIVKNKEAKKENDGGLTSLANTLTSAASITQTMLGGTDGVINSLVGTSQSGPSFESRAAAAKANGFLAMEVQYNPSTISYDTVAGKIVNRAGGSMGPDANTPYHISDCPAATTMHVQLVFDDVNVQNAGTIPDNPLSVGGLISSGAAIAKKVMGKEYTVQPQMDGIMSLLTLAQTRQVVFAWSKFSFHGELCNVDSRYTMFNTDGNPIRGVIDISIRQESVRQLSEKEIKQGLKSMGTHADDKYWEEAFNRAFEEGTINGASSLLEKMTNNTFLNNI